MLPRRFVAAGAAALALLGGAGCADLGLLGDAVCGNLVIDEGEDCDGRSAFDGAVCADPGTQSACRYVCGASAKDARCPAGWGCGSDGVCRKSSDAYERFGDPVSFGALHDLRVGDFDGDGAPDVLMLGEVDTLGRMPARILYSPGTTSASEVALPTAVAAPFVGSLDNDGLDDLGFATLEGVSALLGTHDRRLDYAPFPRVFMSAGTSIRAVPMDVIPTQPGTEVVAFVDRKDQGTTLEPLVGGAAGSVLATLPGGEESLASPIVWARLDKGAACDQIVLAFTGASEVHVFTPCRQGAAGSVAWNVGGALGAIPLPPDATVDRGVMIADMNHDGALDLVIGAGAATYVAWGKGDGTFAPASLYALPTDFGAAYPLAVGDLNLDGVPDLVAPGGVFVSKAGGGHDRVYENTGAPWSLAIIADFNANGLPDVAAAVEDGLNIDFLNNAGDGLLNHAVVPTDGMIRHLAAGDFDGDLVTDLAFSQTLVVDDQPVERLTVAFGADHGPPTYLAVLAAFEELDQLAVAAGANGTVLDLFAVAQDRSRSRDDLFVFPGSGTRFMTTSLPLVEGDTRALPVALVGGHFGDDTPDVAAVAVDATNHQLHLWRIGDIEEIAGGVEKSAVLPDDFVSAWGGSDPWSFRHALYMAAGDLHEDLLTHESSDAAEEVVILAPSSASSGGAVCIIADFDLETLSFTARKAQPLEAVISEDSVLQLHDVDGDGLLDAVVLTGSDEEPGEVLVLWNDGKGGLVTDAPLRLQLGSGVASFAVVPAASGIGCDVALLSKDGVSIARHTSSRGFSIEPVSGLPGGLRMVAADFDRDGAVDLAIGEEGELVVYQSVPVNP